MSDLRRTAQDAMRVYILKRAVTALQKTLDQQQRDFDHLQQEYTTLRKKHESPEVEQKHLDLHRPVYAVLRYGKALWALLGYPYKDTIRSFRHSSTVTRFLPVRELAYHSTQAGVDRDVAVIIPCHNYGHFLEETLKGLLHQTVLPKDILVVDDASTDNTKAIAEQYAEHGVRYTSVHFCDVAKARNAGAMMTNSLFLLFHDADDILTPNYIEQCLDVLRDEGVAIAYGNVQHFGDQTHLWETPQFNRDALVRNNYISSHAMIRRQAFDMVGGYRSICNAHEDWDLYKRITAQHWRAAKAHTSVHYRVHAKSMLLESRRDGNRYWKHAALLNEPITIFTPFAGRRETLDLFVDGIAHLNFPREQIHLHWYDTSGDKEFSSLLKAKQQVLDVGSISYTNAPLPALWGHTPQSLIRGRITNEHREQYYYELAVVRAYHEMIRSAKTDYILVLEDDIVPEPDALIQLLQCMDSDVNAVVAHYPCHLQGYSMVWHANARGIVEHYPLRKTGVESVGGSGFGCSLFRTDALRSIPILTHIHHVQKNWYDHLVYTSLKQFGQVLCNWDIDVDHLQTNRYIPVDHPLAVKHHVSSERTTANT
ncbi:MAG: glycosyltransferase [Candidatus Peregrinibacteria bacterium]|nr:glycosyltransferase [Candidatus Peregrinibacteria bacterium]MCB9807752.1 glycosyltransferase [Candidatus Peribacteria bacterium]